MQELQAVQMTTLLGLSESLGLILEEPLAAVGRRPEA